MFWSVRLARFTDCNRKKSIFASYPWPADDDNLQFLDNNAAHPVTAHMPTQETKPLFNRVDYTNFYSRVNSMACGNLDSVA